jgi:hypothetical protein
MLGMILMVWIAKKIFIGNQKLRRPVDSASLHVIMIFVLLRRIMMIKKSDLEGWAYYAGYCRNSRVAMWEPKKEHFIYLRTKFGDTFSETIKHPEDDDGYDLFKPYKKLDIIYKRDSDD